MDIDEGLTMDSLRVLLDSHGVDGPIPDGAPPGVYVVRLMDRYGVGADVVLLDVDGEIDVCGSSARRWDVLRYAGPFRLAAPDLPCGHPSACEGRAGATRWCKWCEAENAIETARADRFSALASLDDAIAARDAAERERDAAQADAMEAGIEAAGFDTSRALARSDLDALGFAVRYEGPNLWSASIAGAGRGEGATRDEAIAALLREMQAGADALAARAAADAARNAAIAALAQRVREGEVTCVRLPVRVTP